MLGWLRCLVLLLAPLSSFAQASFTNESEVGVAAANGNSKTSTYNFVQGNEFKHDENLWRFNGRYLLGQANGVETAHFYQLKLRYGRSLSEKISLIAGPGYEKDKFLSIRHRYLFDVGVKIAFIDTEERSLQSEVGYRYMEERRYNGTKIDSHYARLYQEWKEKWNKSFSTQLWAEFLPNFSDSTDYQFNTEASVIAVLNDVFSLKSSLLLRYDHLPAPAARSKTDSLLTTALVAKF